MSGALDVIDAGVEYSSRRSGKSFVAVDRVSLSLPAGGAVGLVGESGCGKTTLARAITGIQPLSTGRIELDGVALGRRTRAQHRAIQLVFQDPFSSLNPRMRVGSALKELLSVHGLARGEAAQRRCAELMELVGLPATALDRRPSAFSGGQRQRLAIARALAVNPNVIVADEPVSALDVSIQATILSLFGDIRAELGVGLLLISHDLAVVRQLCEYVNVMYLGRIVESGSRDAVFGDPRHPYTQALLRAAPRVRGETVGRDSGPRVRGELADSETVATGCVFAPRCVRAVDRCRSDAPTLIEIAGQAEGADHRASCHFRDERVHEVVG